MVAAAGAKVPVFLWFEYIQTRKHGVFLTFGPASAKKSNHTVYTINGMTDLPVNSALWQRNIQALCCQKQ